MAKEEWHRYYSEKRIIHQWMQLNLLKNLPVQKVLEIGPYLGAVTAMLANAGYSPTVYDIDDDYGFDSPKVDKIVGDVRDFESTAIAQRQFDAIVCCETLEHIPYEDVDAVVAKFAASGAPYLLLSVPYKGAQLSINLYLNRHIFRKSTSFLKFKNLKDFPKPDEGGGWEPHKWEIGFRDRKLADFTRMIEAHYTINRTEFTGGCKSVFLLCENKSPADIGSMG